METLTPLNITQISLSRPNNKKLYKNSIFISNTVVSNFILFSNVIFNISFVSFVSLIVGLKSEVLGSISLIDNNDLTNSTFSQTMGNWVGG